MCRNDSRATAWLSTILAVLLLAPLLAAPIQPSLAQVPVAQSHQPGLEEHGSHPAIRAPFQGTDKSNQTSSNWSGYAVSSSIGSVTEANGSWIEPKVACPGPSGYSSFWVGIDGWNSNTVEQIGTDSDCQGASPVYYAWYEFYPSESHFVSSVAVLPGSILSASVTCEPTGLECSLAISDLTTGQSFSTSQEFNGTSRVQLSSAEWIAEAPSSPSGATLPLANFGTVDFGEDFTHAQFSGSATINGTSGGVGSFGSGVIEVTMVSARGKVQATPSPLSQDGTSFSVTRGPGGSASAPLSAGDINPSAPEVVEGQAVLLTANPQGGVPPYAIDWYSGKDNCSASLPAEQPLGVGQTFSASPVSSTYYCYSVTDSASPPSLAVSPTDLVTVLPAFAPAVVSVSPTVIDKGQLALISTPAAFVGGTPPFTCAWLEEPPSTGNFSSMGAAFTTGCSPGVVIAQSTGSGLTPGTWTFELLVTDAQGVNETSAPVSLTVENATGPTTTVSCAQGTVVVGSPVRCRATVGGPGAASAGEVSWSSGSAGEFSQNSCTLVKGACAVKFTPGASGEFVGLLAVYQGSPQGSVSSAAYVIKVTEKPTRTTVTCTKPSVDIDAKQATCLASVSGYMPSGTVTWSQKGSGGVVFSDPTCTIAKGSCSVTIEGASPGNETITASYGGDVNNLQSSGTRSLAVGRARSSLTITCTSTIVTSSTPVWCEATVTGDLPTGTVAWSQTSGTGSVAFSSKSCTLTGGACVVQITSVAGGSAKVKAAYGGDANNSASAHTEELNVAGPD